MAGRLSSPKPTLDISTITAARGPRTGKTISKSAGTGRRIRCLRTYSTFSNKQEGNHEETTNLLDDGGTPHICNGVRHAGFSAPFVRHVRSDQNRRVNRRGLPIRRAGQSRRDPLLFDRTGRQTG